MNRLTRSLYIDLGTANTLIYERHRGLILREPSVIALRNSIYSSRAIATGSRAKTMLGKNPENVSVLKPLSQGVIASPQLASEMMRAFFKKVSAIRRWRRPHMVISLPCQVTEFEAQAVRELGQEMGAGRVTLIDEPVAAAIGTGMPVLESVGSLVVDIGGGTSEIALISCGGIIRSEAVRVGGDQIDVGIREHLSLHHQFAVGEQTAEILKIKIASALASDHFEWEAAGLNLVSGLPERRRFTSSQIYAPVESVVRQILAAVHEVLETCPPEVASDIAENGMVLAGGGALLQGLARRFELELGIKARVADDPLVSVARGGAKTVENFKLLDAVARHA